MKILTLADGRHVARWRDPISGRSQQQSLDALGLSSADKRLDWAVKRSASLRVTRAAVASGTASSIILKLDDAVEQHLDREANLGTRQSKSTVLRGFAAWAKTAGVVDAQQITGPVLAGWRDYILRPTSKLAASTRLKHLRTGGTFVRWLQDIGAAPLVNGDHIRRAVRTFGQQRAEIDFLRAHQIRRLLQAARRHDDSGDYTLNAAPIILLGLLTGMRRGELAGLRWDEVDVTSKAIVLPPGRTKTKRGRTVDLAISPAAIKLLETLRLRTPGPVVFPDATYTRLANLSHRLAKFGFNGFGLHLLRKTCGTHLTCAPSIYGSASAFLSARRLGHSVQVAESRYVGTVTDIPAGAKTVEEAMGVADIAGAIAGGTDSEENLTAPDSALRNATA